MSVYEDTNPAPRCSRAYMSDSRMLLFSQSVFSTKVNSG